MRGTAVKFNHNQQSRSQITPLRPVPRLRDCPIINIWLRGQMRNFEDNLSAKSIIIQFTSKPERGLSVLFSNMVGEKEKQKQVRMTQRSTLIGWFFLNWNCDWTTAWQAVMSNWMNSRKAPWIKTGKSSALQTTLFENYLERAECLSADFSSAHAHCRRSFWRPFWKWSQRLQIGFKLASFFRL